MNYKLDNPIITRDTKTVYKEDGKTIKLFIKYYSKSDILNEALNQTRVEEGTNLNIPKLIEVEKVNNRWAIVLEHIEGKSLAELMQQYPEKEEEYLNLFVETQLNILSNSVELLNGIKDKYKRKLNKTDNMDNEIKYELMQRLNGMKEHTKLCHGDFNPSNVIINEKNEVYIIDWAHVTRGNASADAAMTFLILSIEGKNELAQKYINMFCEKSGIEKSNIQRWIPIVAAIQRIKGKKEEQEILDKWMNIVEYQ